MQALVETQIKPFYETERFSLFCGDCRSVLPTLDDCSVDSIVTDPPYMIGFMGKAFDKPKDNVAASVELWREVLRVLKPGGHLLAFGGSRTYHRLACAIEDAGFEIRDQIQWIYGSGFPKSRDIGKDIEKIKVGGIENLVEIGSRKGLNNENGTRGFSYSQEYVAGISIGGKQINGKIPIYQITNEWNGWGTALKPAHEPIVLARKPLEGTVAANVLKHGTGGLNIDGCRIEGDEDGSRNRPPSRVGSATTYAQDEWTRTAIVQRQDTTGLGRWPSNVTHDGSDEVLAGFPDVGVSSGGGMKDLRGGLFQGSTNPNITHSCGLGDSGSAARFFKECKDEARCSHCALPMAENSLIIGPCNANGARASLSQSTTTTISNSALDNAPRLQPPSVAGRQERSSWFAQHAASLLQDSPAITPNIVRRLAIGLEAAHSARNVWSAKSLCDLCAIATALVLAEIKLLDFSREESQVIQGFTGSFNASIPIQNLALNVAHRASIDITQTTLSLLKLFGSASPAITAFTSATTSSAPSRFTYQPKADQTDRNEGCEDLPHRVADEVHKRPRTELDDPRRHGVTPRQNNHPTVKPTELMRYLCRLITPPGGLVLDPFCGSGSTGKAAMLEGLKFIGAELSADYCELAQRRIEAVTRQGMLFA